MRQGLIGLAVVAALIAYLVRLSDLDLVPIPDIHPEITLTTPKPAEDKTPKAALRKSLSQPSTHLHQHTGHGSEPLPNELEQYLENQRKDATEIEVIPHGDGTATVRTGNQFSTVLMMVIDEDGNRRMVERQITPKGQIVVPSQSKIQTQ